MFWEVSCYIRNPGRASKDIYQKIASLGLAYSKAGFKRTNPGTASPSPLRDQLIRKGPFPLLAASWSKGKADLPDLPAKVPGHFSGDNYCALA